MSETTLIAEKFNRTNHATLWALRSYHGYNALRQTYCDPLGRLIPVTSEHADRLIEAGKNVYVDVPVDPNCPVAGYNGSR